MADSAAPPPAPSPQSKKKRPPRSAQYSFSFTVLKVEEVVVEKKSVVFYFYSVRVQRANYGGGPMRVFTFPTDPNDVRFRKRWSEIDAFDREWCLRVGRTNDGSNPLHDELRLDPFKISKLTSPLMMASSVRPRRTARFVDYINGCMSDERLHRDLARFLSVPSEVLAPPPGTGFDYSDIDHIAAGGPAEDRAGLSSAPPPPEEFDPNKPLLYTKRKVRRKKAGEDDDEPSQSQNGAPVAPGQNQYRRDGSPNSKWLGPTADEWAQLEQFSLAKLPHSLFGVPKPKLRTFNLLPLEGNSPAADAALAKIKAARSSKRGGGVYDALDRHAYVFTFDSKKSDVLETFFVFGDANIPWRVTFDQSDPAGQFVKHAPKDGGKKSPLTCYASKSLTIVYREGTPNAKTLDLIASTPEEHELLKRALTYIQWREQGKVVQPFSPAAKQLMNQASSTATAASSASPSPMAAR